MTTQDRKNCAQKVHIISNYNMGLSIDHSPTLRKPLDMLELSPLPTMLTGVIVNLKTSHALLSGDSEVV